jgi:hypothetical protein
LRARSSLPFPCIDHSFSPVMLPVLGARSPLFMLVAAGVFVLVFVLVFTMQSVPTITFGNNASPKSVKHAHLLAPRVSS